MHGLSGAFLDAHRDASRAASAPNGVVSPLGAGAEFKCPLCLARGRLAWSPGFRVQRTPPATFSPCDSVSGEPQMLDPWEAFAAVVFVAIIFLPKMLPGAA